ncbi:MAG: DUF1361 domain-containing protein [Bacteroidia bacterium]
MKNNVLRVMTGWSAMSMLLLVVRLLWSDNLSYIFLAWNLFLAWIPLFISIKLRNVAAAKGKTSLRFFLFGSWLLFFPNSPYILTDLFHLHQRPEIPLWFDLILILSFALNGLMLGYASLFKVRKVMFDRLHTRLVDFFMIVLICMCSFGIYLGRYPRYNSWDLISNPVSLMADIFNMLIHPFHHTRMVGVTFFFSLFLIAGYWTLNTLIVQKKDERE